MAKKSAKKTVKEGSTVDMEDLISQTEAARLREVTRSAIHRLVKRAKLTGYNVGGRVLVSRREVESFEPGEAGRPKTRKGGQ